MLYSPQFATNPTTVTAGLTTFDIPADSSSPTSGPLVLTLSIDPNAPQQPYQINFLLTVAYDGDPTALTVTLPTLAGTYAVADNSPIALQNPANLYVALQNSAIPGTWTLTITATDGVDTASAYATLTCDTPSGSTVPTAPTNGEYSVFTWPTSLTLGLDTSASVTAGPYPPLPPLAPLSYSVSGHPPDVLIVPGPITKYGDWQLTFYTSPTTAAGVYNVTVTGFWVADPLAPPPANADWTASIVLQLTVNPSYVAPMLNFAAPVRGRNYGIVGGRSRAGHVLRALSMPLQPNTAAQVNWRHQFRTYKLQWKSIGPGGANNTPSLSVDPQTAWLMQNLTFNGILTPGPTVHGVQTQGTLGPCATGEAFQMLCQTTRAQLNLPPLPTPPVTDQYLAFPTSPYTATLGQFNVTIAGITAPSSTVPGITLRVTWAASPLPAAPSAFGATASGLILATSDPSHVYDTITVLPPSPATATATSSTATFTIPSWNTYASVVGDKLTTTGFSPSGYNVTDAVITANTLNSVTIAVGSNPGPMTTAGMASIADVIEDDYVSQITCSPTPATPTGPITLNFHFTDGLGTHTGSLTLDATAGAVSVAFPSPNYQLMLGMRVAVSLGPSFEVLGFIIQPKWSGHALQPNQVPGGTVPFLYQISASPQYTSGSKKPGPASWRVLGFFPNSPVLDNSATLGSAIDGAAVLAAWKAKFNDSPATGYIGIRVCLVNPADGTAGQSISATASFAAGTDKGIDFASSTAPYFTLATNNQGAQGAPGDTITISYTFGSVSYHLCLFETDYNGQAGPAAYTASLPYDSTYAGYPPLPAWLTLTFATPTQTAPTEYPQVANTWYTEYSLALDLSAPAGLYTLELTGSTPTKTLRARLILTVT